MKQRLTQPKNNKYYIRLISGGYNGAVQGSPTVKGADVLCNCVGYANGRFNESILDPNLKGVALKFKYQLVCNAENFIESAKRQGLKISKVPTLGGIMVWQKGNTLDGWDGAGHVAFVEQINDNGSIVTSESGWAAFAFKRIARTNSNGRWGMAAGYKFRGCIINPSIGAVTKPTPNPIPTTYQGELPTKQLKKGSTGEQVKLLQKFLNWYGGCDLVVDGIFGAATDKAVRNFQKKNGLDVDGIVGPKTRNKMKVVKK